MRLGANVKMSDQWTFGVLIETGNVARSANVRTCGSKPRIGLRTAGRFRWLARAIGWEKPGLPWPGSGGLW